MATKTNSLFKCKSWYAKLLLAFFMTVFSLHTLYAYGFEVDGIYYNINEDGINVSITSQNNDYPYYDSENEPSGDIVIPSTVSYNDVVYSVTSIGDFAFSYCSSLTSISIPENVTSIGSNAFTSCTSLTYISIPERVTSIGEYAFMYCSSLTSIPIPRSTTSIGDCAFRYCTSLIYVDIPNSVSNIGRGIFERCDSLKSISVASDNPIYDSRENCNAIIHTTSNTLIAGCQNTFIPNNVTSIGSYAFDCSSLTAIEIPNSVTSIGNSAFGGNLSSITVAVDNPVYDSREDCNAIIETASNTLIFGCKNTVIPNSVTSLGIGAFSGCDSLTSIEIPNSVKSIGAWAFNACIMLSSITIPNNVELISLCAFQSCWSLTSIEIPNSVTIIGGFAFNDCTSLKSIICYAESIPELGEDVFRYVPTDNAVLYVPASAVDKYKIADQWKEFRTISSIDVLDPSTWIQEYAAVYEVQLISSEGYEQDESSKTYLDLAAIAAAIGTDDPILYGESWDGDKMTYSDAYSATPNPGFWMASDGISVGSWGTGSAYGMIYDNGVIAYYAMPDDQPTGATYESRFYLVNEGNGKYAKITLHIEYVDKRGSTSSNVIVNATNFPDDNFRSYLLKQPYGEDGYITYEEIESTTSMDVSNSNISSLQGIEYFTALTTLYCNNNKLATLELSRNTALAVLLCYDNLLSALDMSQNTKLKHLDCSGNKLTVLDISNNPELVWLYCNGNQLSALDASRNTALKYLHCNDNQLATLDVSKNAELTEIYCYNNQLQGESMDAFINSLPANTTDEVRILRILTDDEGEGNVCTKAQVAAIKAKGWTPYWKSNGEWIEYAGSIEGYEINKENFPDENFRNYLLQQPYGKDEFLYFAEIDDITYMDVSGRNISSLQGIEHFTALMQLLCGNNKLTTLDVSQNTELTHLGCDSNQLTALNVSENTKLIWLYCHSNKLAALDVSNNTELRYLHCYDNQLTSLDVSRNTELKSLECYNNNISGYAMDTFISSLPMNTGTEPQPLRLLTDDMDEGNSCTTEQAQAFKAKGWTPMIRIDGVWVEYEGATAISQLNAEDANDENAEYYTLDGVRIEKPTKKGIYIKNGKKVLIK